MAQMTVAQRRERQLIRFNEDYIHDLDRAKYLVNSYHRLCGLIENVFYRENDERLYNSPYTQELEAKQDRWIERLNNNLAPYGLSLCWSGLYPTIGIKGKNNCIEHTCFYLISY